MNLITSTFVAGILLLSILSLSMNVSQSSTKSTMDQITKTNLANTADIIRNDFPKIGYNANDPKITSAGAQSIAFKSDLDNDGTVDNISWTFTSNAISGTKNPNDFQLDRTVNGNTTVLNSGVTKFKMTYYDGNHNETTDPGNIRSIKVELICESPEQVDNEYVSAAWEKLYVPWNLQDH